jgi:hypothetical protein
MERRINKKIDDHLYKFKNDIVNKLSDLNNDTELSVLNNISNYIYNYECFHIEKEDLLKRKRVKNSVPIFERCFAKRANGLQCTRRKKCGDQFCGTHIKGTPHGFINDEDTSKVQKKVEVYVVEIMGIAYHIDDNNNVYSPEDVMKNNNNPRIIAHYEKDEKGDYRLKD